MLSSPVPIDLSGPAEGPALGAGIGPPILAEGRRSPYLETWLRSQSISVTRHAAALRPFRRGEFGSGAVSPSEAHRRAANALIVRLQRDLLRSSRRLTEAAKRVSEEPAPEALRAFSRTKERVTRKVKGAEKVWEFYQGLFMQRQTPAALRLLAADRIGLDCYRAVYGGLGTARSVPSPPPFSYQETGFAPATFRRGVRMTKLGKRSNPFPLIKLPHHRLVNPWTLGAVSHEVAHNLQADLGLWQRVPREIGRRLSAEGADPRAVAVWRRWHKETFADLVGLLLSGPAYVGSLMDIVAHSQRRIAAFNSAGVHPTPYLRVFINIELLRRMGFRQEAERYRRAWERLYPRSLSRSIPAYLMRGFGRANRIVVDTICFTRFAELGRRSLAEIVPFTPQHQSMVREAARRLASGTNPGIVPERFLMGAARVALESRLARPGAITKNFYETLGRR